MSVFPPPVFISTTISFFWRNACQLRKASDWGSQMFSTVPRNVSVSKILSGFVSLDRFFGVILKPLSLPDIPSDPPVYVRI